MSDALLDIQMIDCDGHFTEPADMWERWAPASVRSRLPRLHVEGVETYWTLDGDMWTGIGGNTIAKGREKVLGTLTLPFEEIDEASWDVGRRLALMDDMGIYAQIIYPNALGFASNALFAIEDVEFRNLLSSIYNDFFFDLQRESNGRLLPQAVLPVWDMELTVAEMVRAHDAGMLGFTITDKPQLVGLPDLDHEYFAPMWQLGNEMKAVFNFHIGSGGIRGVSQKANMREVVADNAEMFWSSFGPQRRLAILATQTYMSNVRIITNLCMSSMFDRYPNVKIVSAESGIGWVPFILEAMEYQLDQMVTAPAERALQQRRPTEYFRDHIFVTTWFERSSMKLIDDIGVGNILIETDVPHPTCLYPGAREHFADVMSALEPAIQRRLLQENAAELYGIRVPERRSGI